ncbi:MAG: ribose 5-phosphate isomerase B [Candidatus Coatesbacteria bacterium]|nr:MAG: ribose 5-phosphate isomerase B [Candidatus Coatesbacteria bacterium]
MKIAFGCDHRGYALKGALVAYAREQGHEPLDFGTDSAESCDYVDHGRAAAEAVARGEADIGVLICGSGIGMSIVGNKIPGIRAGLALDEAAAEMTRAHNDANVLALSADRTDEAGARAIFDAFVATPFEGGRHARRVGKIVKIEEEYCK